MGIVSDVVLKWRTRKQRDFGLGKVGIWTQDNSLSQSLAMRPHWFISNFKSLEVIIARSNGNTPIFAAITSRTLAKHLDSLIKYRPYIRGLIWDYEVGAGYSEATDTLTDAYRTCKSMGLLFGVAVLANPEGSLAKNGVKYQDADNWCNFLMPMLYSQWFNHNPDKVRRVYISELKASPVPLIPIIAYESTSDRIKPENVKLTPARVRNIYWPLKFPCFSVWNVENMPSETWDNIRAI